jgi:hypothetical protein
MLKQQREQLGVRAALVPRSAATAANELKKPKFNKVRKKGRRK